MRPLVIVALLAATAHADNAIATAFAKGDVAALEAATEFPLEVTGLWFDTEPCQRFSGNGLTVDEAEFPELVKCVVDLAPRTDRDPNLVVYGAGSPLFLRVVSSRLQGVFGLGHTDYVDRPDAVPIEAKLFAARIARFDRAVYPPAKDRARLDASPTAVARASLRVCVDPTGKVDSVAVSDVSDDLPSYGEHLEKAARTWKLKPFVVRGRPVRACGRFFVGYPADRISKAELAKAATPPAPRVARTIAEAAFERQRRAGTLAIVPDAATRQQMAAERSASVSGAWWLCLEDTGAIAVSTMRKSTGYPAYDRAIAKAIATWKYRPYLLDGKPWPVCSMVTVSYRP